MTAYLCRFLPVRGPTGSSASVPNPSTLLRTGQDGSGTRGVYPEPVGKLRTGFVEGLKQPSPKGSIRGSASAAPNAGARIKRLGNFKVAGLCRPTRRRGGVGAKGFLAGRSGCWGQEYFVGC